MSDIADTDTNWLLFVTNLPGRNPTLRMRIWRALKSAGAASLRDGVYILPSTAQSRKFFEEQAWEVLEAGGSAQILSLDDTETDRHEAFVALFDRTSDYAHAKARLDELKQKLSRLRENEARRRIAVLKRDIATLSAIDFFPGEARAQIQRSVSDLESAFAARYSKDEPTATHRKIVRRERASYRARIWATREHLWIDRVCSAWLIRRFIDPKAKFIWLKKVKDCPKRALGFDFDGAVFTHIDNKVTFEVLMTSFGLDENQGLARLSALVHFLDVGGIPVVEAAGFASIMNGVRSLNEGDDALLKAMTPVIDGLYANYSQAK